MIRSRFLGDLHRLLVEIERRGHRRRVRGIRQHHRQRLGDRMLHGPLDAAQKGVAVRRLDVADRCSGDDEPELVDRIGRVRHQDDVTGRGDRHRHVGEALLRSQGRDDLGFRIELDPEPARIIAGLGLAQTRDALRRRVAMRARPLHRLDHLVDDVLGRIHVGIAIPRSMISAPRARAAAFNRLTSANTYGGSRLMRWNSSITWALSNRECRGS